MLNFDMITTVYQPIIRLSAGEIAGYEALVRYPGLNPLNLFARAAEERRVRDLDLACVRRACEEAAGWLPPGKRLFINLAPETLAAVAAWLPE